MSKATSPFPQRPERRPRPPINSIISTTNSPPVLPLSVNRPPSRNGGLPGDTSSIYSSTSSPARPIRSERRPRQLSEYSQDPGPSRLIHPTDNVTNGPPPITPRSRTRSERSQLNGSVESDVTYSGRAAIAAFQSAATRKRVAERDDERRKEQEQEELRQRQLRERVQGRRANGKARALGSIDAVLDEVSDEWAFTVEPDFNPVDLALALLDDSSLGKDMQSFIRTKRLLSKALNGTVDKNNTAFAAALPHHANLINSLTSSQNFVGETRTALQSAKDALTTKRADLVQLWSRGQQVEQMMKLIDEIEHLKSVPDVLETLMTEKRLLQAAIVIVRNLKLVGKPDMLEIGAVADLRSYLTSQENSLRDILVDELQNHLFLKSFWCESRWKAYTPFQDKLPGSDAEKQTSRDSSLHRPAKLSEFLDALSQKANDPIFTLPDDPGVSNESFRLSAFEPISQSQSKPVSSEADSLRNPESDSFSYIETLLESLAVLGSLDNSLDLVSQRLPVELNALVDGTVEEVSERAEYQRRMSILSPAMSQRISGSYIFEADRTPRMDVSPQDPLQSKVMSLRLAALEHSSKHGDREVLRDLFWTLYSKLDAVLQSMCVVNEISARIHARRDYKQSPDSKIFSLSDNWLPVQSEVRKLLDDYLLAEDLGNVSGRNPVTSISEVLRDGRYNRDPSRPFFHFPDSDSKSLNRVLKQYESGLTRVLNDTVPGLVGLSADSITQVSMGSPSDERRKGGTHHRLLVTPDAFHVNALFQPTLAFLDRVATILPSGFEAARASSAVLEEFVLHVYLPQLEEKVSEIFQRAASGPDAFHEDPSCKLLPHGSLTRSSMQLVALINSLCSMLQATPFHRENYSKMILSITIQFYQKCSDHFYELVTRPQEGSTTERRLALSTKWAQDNEVMTCLSDLLSAAEPASITALCQREVALESSLLGDNAVSSEDILRSIRDIGALCRLYSSLAWFISHMTALRIVTPNAEQPKTPVEPLAEEAHTPLFSITMKSNGDALELPLSEEIASRFDALMQTYRQLADLILCTIRIDFRCRAFHYLDLALRHGNYDIEREASEPDPHIVDLNIELGKCEEILSETLPLRQQQFAVEGLDLLLEHLLITNARFLRTINDHGVRKILRNIISLQQRTRTFSGGESVLERARDYYNLFFMEPPQMVEIAKKDRYFTFQEYKILLSLMCGIDLAQAEHSGTSSTTDKNYNMYLIDLHSLEFEDNA